MRVDSRWRRVIFCACGVVGVSEPVQAQSTGSREPVVEEIMVTARKTVENIQETPVAVSVLADATLRERAIDDISQIAASTPSMRFDPAAQISGSSNSVTVFIRGVGQTDFNLTIDPGVGIYLDGVYISRAVGALLETTDVERIETLRGPQGALFGKNTIGGAIAITSKRPAAEPAFSTVLTTGSFGRADAQVSADLPYGDNFRMRLTGARLTRDGYVERLADGGRSGDRDALIGRLVTEWVPDANVTLTLALDGTRTREATVGATALRIFEVNPQPDAIQVHFPTINNLALHGASCAPSNPARLADPLCYNSQWLTGDPRKTWSTGSNHSDSDVWGAALTAEASLGNAKLKSISAYRELKSKFDLDTDMSPVNLVNTANDYSQRQYSQELQLSGASLGSRLRWLFGLYYLNETGTDINGLTTVLTTFRSGGSVDNDSYAAFGQLVFALGQRASLSAGGRYTAETKRFSPDAIVLSTLPIPLPFAAGDRLLPLGEVATRATAFTPSVSFDYRLSDAALAYVSYSKGFKSGGFTQRVFPPEPRTPTFRPEFLESYEAGLKSELFERHVRWNSAVFRSNYTDQQVIVLDGFAPKVRNAGDARIWGVESEVEAVASSRLRINGSISYLKAKYIRIDPRAAPVNLNSKLVNTPEWMGSLGFTGKLWSGARGELSTRWDWSYSSELAKDAENTPELLQRAYQILNASVTYASTDDRWAVTVGGTNLTGEDYLLAGSYNASIGAVYGVYNPPREWYARLSLHF